MIKCKYWDCGWCYNSDPFHQYGTCPGFENCSNYKPRGKRMKKYRVRIPDMIEKRHAWIANALGCEDTVINELLAFDTLDGTVSFYDIPKTWLEEIKDEPITAEEWLRSEYPERYEGGYIKTSDYHDSNMRHAFRSGEENERKKHKPDYTLKDALEAYHNSRVLKDVFSNGWNSCLRAHNLQGVYEKESKRIDVGK